MACHAGGFPALGLGLAFCPRWSFRGLPQALVTRLREICGRDRQPSACITVSRMVKCAGTAPKAASGYRGGKKVTGRGWHIVVGAGGRPLAVAVLTASVSDKAGAEVLLIRLFDAFSTLRLMWAGTGCNGKPPEKYARPAGITVEVAARTSPHSFQELRRRWVAERTFGWLMRYRRPARDYERRPGHHEAMVWWALSSS